MTAIELAPPQTDEALDEDWGEDEDFPFPEYVPEPQDRPAATGVTAEQFLALPENDGVDRELILGELWERPMSTRNRRHGRAEAGFAGALWTWNLQRPGPRGEVVAGDAGFHLPTDPDTVVGIDVTYVSPELSASTAEDVRVFAGAPVLAIEIISPSNTYGEINRKIAAYLQAGVPVTWVADPVWRTVLAYRPDAPPVLFNADQEIDAEPHLSGFKARVADLFA